MKLRVLRTANGADLPLPSYATAGSAGLDLRAAAAFTLKPGERALVPTGLAIALPEGYEAQVRPRSGTALKTDLVIVNSPGTIDADYPDEWCVPVKNGGTAPLTVRDGERIAQMVLARYEVLPFTPGTVTRTTDRAGGFGSTGR